MNFLQQNCRFGFYTQGKAALCKSFKCGDNDLDDFFTKDAFLQSEELLCKNYCFSLVDDPAQLVAVFTLSNDSIKKIPGSRKRKIEKNIPREKIYSSYPAVMIGRLGISLDFHYNLYYEYSWIWKNFDLEMGSSTHGLYVRCVKD